MTELLSRGIESLAIDSPAAIPDNGTKSAGIAIPFGVQYLSYDVRPVGSFDTISVSLQVANNNVEEEFTSISTATAAGTIVVGPVASNFCRIIVNSSTGAGRTGLVVGVLGR